MKPIGTYLHNHSQLCWDFYFSNVWLWWQVKECNILCIPSWFFLGLSLLTNSTVQYVCTYLLCSLNKLGGGGEHIVAALSSPSHICFRALTLWFVVGLKYCWAQMIVKTRQRQISSRAITLLFMVEFRYCLEQLICREQNSGRYLQGQGHQEDLVLIVIFCEASISSTDILVWVWLWMK